jgi:hypothetical protein
VAVASVLMLLHDDHFDMTEAAVSGDAYPFTKVILNALDERAGAAF